MPKKTSTKSKPQNTNKSIVETPAELNIKVPDMQKEKFRWLSIEMLSFFVAIASLIIAMYSIGEAKKANRIAQEANQIAKDALLPQIIISYVYPINSYADFFKDPCIEKFSNDVIWTSEFGSVFDVSNIGNKAISLTDISSQRETITNNSNIKALTEFDFFISAADFEQWFASKGRDSAPLSREVLQSLENSTSTGPPIKIEPGETRRLIIRGSIRARINPEYTINEIYRSSDPSWETNITFVFGDGSSQGVSVYVPGPYEAVMPERYGEYQSCPEQ